MWSPGICGVESGKADKYGAFEFSAQHILIPPQ
jgi:hypothetical protein